MKIQRKEVGIKALKRPRGTNDFLGDKVKLMTKLEETVRDVCKSFGYKRNQNTNV